MFYIFKKPAIFDSFIVGGGAIENNKIAVIKSYLRIQMYLLHANALLSLMTLETGNIIYGRFVRQHAMHVSVNWTHPHMLL